MNSTTTPMARAPVKSEKRTAACLVSSGRRLEIRATTSAPTTGVRIRTDSSGNDGEATEWPPSEANSRALIRSPPSRG